MLAVILGVNGVSGRAIAAELSESGWDVVGSGRHTERFPVQLRDRGVRFVRSDRHDRTPIRRLRDEGSPGGVGDRRRGGHFERAAAPETAQRDTPLPARRHPPVAAGCDPERR